MKNDHDRESSIHNYVMKAQIVFFAVCALLLLKFVNLEVDGYSLETYGILILLISFLLGISMITLSYQKKPCSYTRVYIIMIAINLIITSLTIICTEIYEVGLLYLIPVIICATIFGASYSIALTIFIGIMNVFLFKGITNIYIANCYALETDIAFTGILILIGWLIGSQFAVEKKVRKNLESTKYNLFKNTVLLENLINEMPLGLIVIDKQGKIVHTNEQIIDILNLELNYNELIGTDYYDLYQELKISKANTDSMVCKVLEGKTNIYQEEKILNDKIFDIVCKPIHDHHILKYIILTFTDITQEEKISQNAALLERLETINQTVASVAHEIKNPLTTIKGFLDLSLQANIELDKSHLELLNSEVDRCIHITTDFLSVAKKPADDKEFLNLKNLINDHSLLLEKDALFNDINLELRINQVSDLLVNEDEIKQLLLNLTRNSIEAVDHGGKIIISLYEDKDYVYLEVEDNGKGIPEEVLKKIGTPFFTTKASGTGLGMTICYQIAEKNNAQMEINSSPEIGTKITIKFLREGVLYE